MVLTNILIVLGGVITVVASIPYLVGVIRGTTKPRVASWFVWSVLTGISCVAALVEHQYPTMILLLAASLETLAVVVLGLKLRHGDKKIERIDIVCLTGAVIGAILWWAFNSPAIAVIATIAIDLIGGVPTLIHSWKKPDEETWDTFFLSFLGAICTLLVVNSWRVTAFAYPLFLVVINLTFTLVIIVRRRALAI